MCFVYLILFERDSIAVRIVASFANMMQGSQFRRYVVSKFMHFGIIRGFLFLYCIFRSELFETCNIKNSKLTLVNSYS